MAAASLADVQRRVAENPDARYRAFDSYPWAKDRVFTVSRPSLSYKYSIITRYFKQNKEQLSSALQNKNTGDASLFDIALQTRIRRFEHQTQIKVDGDAYKQWLAQTSHSAPRLVSEQAVALEAMTVVRLGPA